MSIATLNHDYDTLASGERMRSRRGTNDRPIARRNRVGEQLVSIAEAAEQLGVSRSEVRRRINGSERLARTTPRGVRVDLARLEEVAA